MDFRYFKKRTAFFLAFIILISSFFSLPVFSEDEILISSVSENTGNSVSGDTGPDKESSVSGDSGISGNSTSGNAVSENKSEKEPERVKEEWETASIDGVTVTSLRNNFTKPFAFLTKKKLVLNGMRRSVSDDTYVVFNVDGDYELTGLTGGGLDVSVNEASYNGLPAYRISVTVTSSSQKGNTKLSIIPRNKTNGIQLNTLKLVVSVKKKNPEVKWKNNLVVLNRSVKGDYALNSPNVDGVAVLPLSGNARYKPSIPACIDIELQNENTIKISAGKGTVLNKTYPVTLWLMYTDSTDLKAVKRKFNVKLTDGSKIVKLKKVKDSSLDLSDRRGTAWHYRPMVSNTGFVVNKVSFREGSMSENYVIENVFDPNTKEVTDFYVRAKNGAALHRGPGFFNFDILLQAAGMDIGDTKQSGSFNSKRKSAKLKTAFVSGNTLKIDETLSDNHIAGSIELRVKSPKYAAIDWYSVKDLTNNSAFSSHWTIDRYGQVARIRVEIDKSKVIPGKKYSLTYSVKARGADTETVPTKIVVKYRA